MQGTRAMKLHVVPTVAALILAPLFVALGWWQLQRADEKRDLQAQYDGRAAGPLTRVGSSVQAVDALQFYRVEAFGWYDTAQQLLVDNRVHRGVAGYHVITPLRIDGGDARLLVNRGWIPWGADRAQLPAIPTPTERVHVTGVAMTPHEPGFMLGENAATQNGMRVWQHLDLNHYRDTVSFPVQPVVVLLDPASPAGGFVREWNRLDAGIAVHQGYAFQWFALAAAVVAVFFLVARRAAKKGDR